MLVRLLILSFLVFRLPGARAQVAHPIQPGSGRPEPLDYPLNRFENDIRVFEKQDSLGGIPKGSIRIPSW